MKTAPALRGFPLLTLGAGLALTAAVVGLVFALWAQNGVAMFASMIEAGLALCF